jgi:hypothetical protein
VDFDVANRDDVLAGAAAVQHLFDAHEQFENLKGLDDIVLRAVAQALHLAFHVVFRGQVDDRDTVCAAGESNAKPSTPGSITSSSAKSKRSSRSTMPSASFRRRRPAQARSPRPKD